MSKLINRGLLEIKKSLLVPYIFTNKQLSILKKKMRGIKLNRNERYYYYTSITKKIEAIKAMLKIQEGLFINGGEFMLKQRIEKAKRVLGKFARNHKDMDIFMAGSFLYKKDYNDIDIFIFSRYDKEDYRKGRIHVNYLPPEAKKSLFFKSVYQISISNFNIVGTTLEEKIEIDDLISLYQELIIYILKGNPFKQELRNFIIGCTYIREEVILNSTQLMKIIERIMDSKNKIGIINQWMIQTLIHSKEQSKTKDLLKKIIKMNVDILEESKNTDNLEIYIRTYKEAVSLAT